jgi:hypothetical protein
MSYKHTQTGWLTLMVCGALLPFFVITAVITPDAPVRTFMLFVTAPILAVVIILFGSLTVAVDDAAITMRFGPGLIRKKIKLDDVAACEPVKNRWWWGWGIQLIPGGWLYNVSGLDAVELKLKNGRVCRIGTDEPQILNEFIQAKLNQPL